MNKSPAPANNPATVKKGGIPTEYIEQQSLDGVPLDFSFKEIKDLSAIVYIQPRKGVRKPIPINTQDAALEEEQADQKTEETKKAENSASNNTNQNQSGDEDKKEGEENRTEETTKQEEEQKQQHDAQALAKKIAVDVNLNPEPRLAMILAAHNISAPHSSNTRAIGVTAGKQMLVDDGKFKQNKKLKINLVTTAVILSYNQIRSLNNFSTILDSVMHDALKNLLWLDLSHNYLEELSPEIAKFEQLRSLYLHFNYIKNLEELEKLKELKQLSKFMVHGNPIDQLPNFRIFAIGILPQVKTLDTVVVSKKERDNANTWYNTFKKKYPKLKVDAKSEKLGKTLKQAYPEYFPPEPEVIKKEEDDI